MRFFSSLGWIAALAVSASAMAQDYKAGELRVDHPYARPTVASQSSGAVYLTLENFGRNPDQLVSVSSPAATSAEIHTMSMEGNVMKMREAGSIEIKPQQKISMIPGQGYHIMLLGLKQPLKTGEKFPITLTFKHAGKIEARFQVEDKPAQNGSSAAPPAKHAPRQTN